LNRGTLITAATRSFPFSGVLLTVTRYIGFDIVEGGSRVFKIKNKNPGYEAKYDEGDKLEKRTRGGKGGRSAHE
jgi:hypothetical protein